ncbi:MAG: DUF91 domain-containing protein [Ignavibacteriae bacterium]|nr:DUF91 domain-containing protein [Ignavibacteriota bacterium]
MATEIKTWQIVDGKLTAVTSSLTDGKRKEKEDLERWIKTNPEILGEDITLIGEQVETKSGPLDFLGIDNKGNIVIVELKRDSLPREVLAQAIDYASDVADWDIDKLSEICQAFTGQSLADYLSQKFPETGEEELVINQAQRLLLVGFSIEESLNRMLEWLSSKYSIGINAIILNYTKTGKGDELLSRTVAIPEEVERAKTNRQRFVIDKSNEPGTYDENSLQEKLTQYLSKDLHSAKRIRDYILPILLTHDIISREELRKEFVKMGGGNENQAGYFLALIF